VKYKKRDIRQIRRTGSVMNKLGWTIALGAILFSSCKILHPGRSDHYIYLQKNAGKTNNGNWYGRMNLMTLFWTVTSGVKLRSDQAIVINI
jgi:hypothetical protein